ncbi:hypothetical protein TNCV_3049791 [Trichonephila clavipes]|nr:hypothetical protein TNCV_3049791 [Trichonephila clavipes]
MAPSLSSLQRYHEVEYGFCHKLSLVTKHGVILNPKASLRASSGNVRLHHLQRNQRPGTLVLVPLERNLWKKFEANFLRYRNITLQEFRLFTKVSIENIPTMRLVKPEWAQNSHVVGEVWRERDVSSSAVLDA